MQLLGKDFQNSRAVKSIGNLTSVKVRLARKGNSNLVYSRILLGEKIIHCVNS